MSAILFALISYIGWGIGDLFGAIVSRKLGGYNSAFYTFVIGFLLNSLYIPFVLADLNKFTFQSLLITIILALLTPVSLIFFYEGLRIGNAAIVGVITSCFGAVAILLSMVFLGERISSYQAVAIVLILLGVILSSLDFRKLRRKNFLLDPGVPFALMAMILWGMYFAFIKIPIRQVGWFWPGYISVGFPVIFLIMKFKKIKLLRPTTKVFIPLIFSALLVNIANFSYNFAIQKGLVTLVAPIASSSVTLFVVLAFLVFKDPITRQQIAGIITTLIGIVLLSVFSV